MVFAPYGVRRQSGDGAFVRGRSFPSKAVSLPLGAGLPPHSKRSPPNLKMGTEVRPARCSAVPPGRDWFMGTLTDG